MSLPPAQTNEQIIATVTASAQVQAQSGTSPSLQAAAGISVSLGVILFSLLGFLTFRYRRRREGTLVELEDGSNSLEKGSKGGNGPDDAVDDSVKISASATANTNRLSSRHELPASSITGSPMSDTGMTVSDVAVSDVSSCEASSPDLPELPEDNFSPSEVPAGTSSIQEKRKSVGKVKPHIAEQMRPEYQAGDDSAVMYTKLRA